MYKTASYIVTVLVALVLTSCSSGDGGGPTGTSAEVTFHAARVGSATCEMSVVDDAGVITSSKTATTNSGGVASFSDIGLGRTLIACEDGNYIDEATGLETTATRLTAVVNAENRGKYAVTPLTDYAFRKVEMDPTAMQIVLDTANKQVADEFSLTDITEPPTDLEKIGEADIDTELNADKYAVILALLSQMVEDDDTLSGTNTSAISERLVSTPTTTTDGEDAFESAIDNINSNEATPTAYLIDTTVTGAIIDAIDEMPDYQSFSSIELTLNPDEIDVGDTIDAEIVKNSGTGAPTNPIVEYISDNTPVATVNKFTGKITGVSAGTANITVRSQEANRISDTQLITVYQSLRGDLVYDRGDLVYDPDSDPVTLPEDQTTMVNHINSSTFTTSGTPTFSLVSGANGISINTATGVITIDGQLIGVGTHTAEISLTSSAGGDPITTSIQIIVTGVAPNISDAASQSYPAGLMIITPLPFTNTGGGATNCEASNNLPAGLTVSVVNGSCQITGTPIAEVAAVTVEITAENNSGSDTAMVSIEITVAKPNIIDLAAQTYEKGAAITPVSFTNIGGGDITGCSASPALPTSLTVTPTATNTTCMISGTPDNITSAAIYTITAENINGNDTATVSITVNDARPMITIANATTTVIAGQMVDVTFINSGGTDGTTFSIEPAIGNGLEFDTNNGAITGTATAVAEAIVYTVTASNLSGSDSVEVTIQVNPAAPNIALSHAFVNAQIGIPIRPVTVINTGGAIDSYEILPEDNPGISFDEFGINYDLFGLQFSTTDVFILENDGLIYGRTTRAGTGTFTVTAINETGSSTATIFIGSYIDAIAPTLSVPAGSFPLNAPLDIAITPIIIGNSGTTAEYSIEPDLPDGLMLNTMTGIISGTPTQPSGPTIYTITATNDAGSNSIDVNIATVLSAPVITDMTTVLHSTVGQPIEAIVFENSGGRIEEDCRFDGDAPAGLTLTLTVTPAACEISGTPNAVISSAIVFIVVAENATGSSTATVSLSVQETALVVSTISNITQPNGEGGSASYTVKLGSKPDDTVFVGIIVGLDTDSVISATPTQLTFTSDEWNTAQMVIITANRDLDSANDTATITTRVASGNYAANEHTATSTIIDNDTAGVRVSSSPSPASISEAGGTSSYIVRLNTESAGTATVVVTPSANGLTFSPASVTLSADTLSGTIMITAIDNDIDANDVNIEIDNTTTSNDTNYNNLSVTTTVTVTDDDTAGVTISQSSLTVGEAGSITYTVVLDTEPTGNVTVTPASDDTGAVIISSSPQLTFNAGNWTRTQTVTLTAVQDADAAAEVGVTITHTIASTDTKYNNLTVANLLVEVTDDDSVTLILSTTTASVNEGAAGVDYTIKLSAQPTGGDVTITVASDNAAATVASTPPLPLTFTASNWNVSKTITITAPQDANAIDETVNISHTASGTDYDDADPVTVTVTVMDNNTPGLALAELNNSGAIEVTQGLGTGGTATYTIVLVTEPTGPVTVGLTAEGAGVSVSPSPLTFTTSTWSVAQVVTVTAEADPDAIDDVGTITYTISDGGYDDVTQTATVVDILDSDIEGVTATATTPNSIAEAGGTSSYVVSLTAAPVGEETVVVTPTPSIEGRLTFSPASVTLSADTLSSTITITAVDNGTDSANVEIEINNIASGNMSYNGFSATTTVTVIDDDLPTLIVEFTDASFDSKIAENGSGGKSDHTIKLSAAPMSNVTITVTSDNTDLVFSTSTAATRPNISEYEVNLSLTFQNWNVPQSIKIKAADDDNTTNETVVISYTASGGGYDGVTASHTFTILDDDMPGLVLVLSNSELDDEINVIQGAGADGTATYTIALRTEPTGPVTVGLATTDGVSVSPSPLTFTTSNWSQTQVVTITATADADTLDDVGTITYTISGGGYGSVTQTPTMVVILDEDVAMVLLSTTTISLNEALSNGLSIDDTTRSYTVRLATEPTDGDVTVTPAGFDTNIVTVEPSSLTFGTGTGVGSWGVPQTIIVTSVGDGVPTVFDGPMTDNRPVASNSATVTINHTVAGYGGVAASSTAVTVLDSHAAYTVIGGGAEVSSNASRNIFFAIARPIVGTSTLTTAEFTVTVAGSSPTSTTESTNNVAVSHLTHYTSNNGVDVVSLALERAIVDNKSDGPGIPGVLTGETLGEVLTLTFAADPNNAHNLESFTETAVINNSTAGDCSTCIVDSQGCPF